MQLILPATVSPALRPDRARRARRKFLRFFPGGFRDETYIDWERSYKWETHERWQDALERCEFRRLLRERQFEEVAARCGQISGGRPGVRRGPV